MAARENVYTQSSQSRFSSSSFRISPPWAFIWTSGLPRRSSWGRWLKGSGWLEWVEGWPDLRWWEEAARKWLKGERGTQRMVTLSAAAWTILCKHSGGNTRTETCRDSLMHVVLPGVQLLPPHQSHGVVISRHHVCMRGWQCRVLIPAENKQRH